MIVLFWDIDGTLLTTGKGRRVRLGRRRQGDHRPATSSCQSIRIARLTDYQIAVRTFELLGVDVNDDADRAAWCAATRSCCPRALPRKQGRVLPNVREILEHLRARTDVRSYLLTGNTRGGARAKLTHYDLSHFFPDGRLCRGRARARHRSPRARSSWRGEPVRCRDDGVFVIGDTPHDIDCANAIGARTIAVATGGYSLDELRAPPVAAFRGAAAADEFMRAHRRRPASAARARVRA